MIRSYWTLDISFEVLDAALYKGLESAEKLFSLDFARQEKTSAGAAYLLSNQTLGLGTC